MLGASAAVQQLGPAAVVGREPQQALVAPALSCSSGDSQAMTTDANAANSPAVSALTSGERPDVPRMSSPLALDGAGAESGRGAAPHAADAAMAADRSAVAKSPCRAMHTTAMTALLGDQPAKGAPDALDVLGIGQHKFSDGPGRWDNVHNEHPAAGQIEAQARFHDVSTCNEARCRLRPSFEAP